MCLLLGPCGCSCKNVLGAVLLIAFITYLAELRCFSAAIEVLLCCCIESPVLQEHVASYTSYPSHEISYLLCPFSGYEGELWCQSGWTCMTVEFQRLQMGLVNGCADI